MFYLSILYILCIMCVYIDKEINLLELFFSLNVVFFYRMMIKDMLSCWMLFLGLVERKC